MVQAPRGEKYLPAFLSVDEAFSVLDGHFTDDAAGCRDRAILEMLYSTGIRVSELAGLNSEDVDEARALVRVRGKGKKERIVPIGTKPLPPSGLITREEGSTCSGQVRKRFFPNPFSSTVSAEG